MIRKGTQVKWKWGKGFAEGKVVSLHSESITKKIEGTDVTRNGSSSDQAIVIALKDGGKALKLKSEVKRKD